LKYCIIITLNQDKQQSNGPEKNLLQGCPVTWHAVLLCRSFWRNNILIQPQTITLWPGNKCATEDNAATMCSPNLFRGA